MTGPSSGIGGQTKNAAGLEVLAAFHSNLALFDSLRIRLPGEPKTYREDTRLPASCQEVFRTATVMGDEPFLVPSQPGMAIEKRPAVPPVTTTWISSTDGNFGISASGSGSCCLPKRRLVPSPLSGSGSRVR